MHGAAVARAVRVVRTCADGGKSRREDKNDRGFARRARTDVRAQGRASDRVYKRVHAFLGDAAMVELVGILGYYVMISMTLNVFRMMPPADAELAFAESK